jgi:GlpG protein
MDRVRALTLSAEEDLALFCAYLAQQRLGHRVFEEQGRQVLEVASAADAERVRSDYAAWRDGRLILRRLPQSPLTSMSWQAALRAYPVVTALTALALMGFPATWQIDAGVLGRWLPWLTIVPIDGGDGELRFASLYGALADGQLWRLVTPIFIHFGVVHLLFNVAVVIEFGRRIERGAGSAVLLLLTLLIASISNVAQFLVTHAPLFGGLSGVAYGLFAYVVARGRFDPAPVWQVNPSFSVGVVIMLVTMSSGVTEWFGLHIANTAHWVGLSVGALAALFWLPQRGSDERRRSNRET